MNFEFIDETVFLPEDCKNMERDVQSLHRAESGQFECRIYKWHEPWVTIGRFQTPDDVLGSHPKRYLVRPTGGGAIVHGHDYTLAMTGPRESLAISPHQIYRKVTEPIREALADCDLQTCLGEEVGFVKSAGQTIDCFARVGNFDIVEASSEVKICGCAMKLTKVAFLIQLSIPCCQPLVDYGDWISGARAHQVVPWDHEEFPATLRKCVSRSQ